MYLATSTVPSEAEQSSSGAQVGGMVHAYVDQNLLKNNKLRVFLMIDNEFLTQHLKIQIQNKTTCSYVFLQV